MPPSQRGVSATGSRRAGGQSRCEARAELPRYSFGAEARAGQWSVVVAQVPDGRGQHVRMWMEMRLMRALLCLNGVEKGQWRGDRRERSRRQGCHCLRFSNPANGTGL